MENEGIENEETASFGISVFSSIFFVCLFICFFVVVVAFYIHIPSQF